MKRLIFLYLIFQFVISYGQNVKIEIGDYSRTIEGKKYATYQFVSASYSYGRSTLVLITTKDLLIELSNKLSILYKSKQEYTDVWILGIDGFDKKNISSVDKKIIDFFLQQIRKYRADNSLPEYTLETLESEKVFLEKNKEVCRYLVCRNKL